MSEAQAQTQTQTLLEIHEKDNPLVVYTARCSYTGTSKDNFLVGVHYVEHDEISEEAWEAFKSQWSEIISMIRAELKYDAIENTDLYELMHAKGDYPQMEEHYRILDHGNLKVDVRIVGTYLYLRIITSSDAPRKVQMARTWNKRRARHISLDAKTFQSKYYKKERFDMGDGDWWVEYTPKDTLKCPHCDYLLTDDMHIGTCLDDAYDALGFDQYL